MFHRKSIVRLLILLFIMAGMIGCAPPGQMPVTEPVAAPSFESPAETEPAAAPSLEPPTGTEPATSSPEQKPPLESTRADFPAEPKPIDAPVPLSGKLYVSEGTYTNESGQAFVITVTGRLPEAVTVYTSEARFLLGANFSGTPFIPEEVKIEKGKSLFEALFSDEHTENLLIDMDLAPADAEKFTQGYDLYFEVDPTVNKGYTHHYRAQHVTPSITTKISVSFGGPVTANLYRNCASTGAKNIYAGGTATSLSYGTGGYAWYDLRVTGVGSTSTYSITQGLWSNYSYYTTSTSPTSGITCW